MRPRFWQTEERLFDHAQRLPEKPADDSHEKNSRGKRRFQYSVRSQASRSFQRRNVLNSYFFTSDRQTFAVCSRLDVWIYIDTSAPSSFWGYITSILHIVTTRIEHRLNSNPRPLTITTVPGPCPLLSCFTFLLCQCSFFIQTF